MKALTLQDYQAYWERSGGDTMGGHFNSELYLAYLRRRFFS